MSKHNISKILFGASVIGAATAGVVAFFTQSGKGKKIWKDSIEHGATLLTLITKKAEKMKALTAASYERLVDEVMEEYQQHRELTEETAKVMNAALKKEWKTIQKGLAVTSRATTKKKTQQK